MYHVTIHPAT